MASVPGTAGDDILYGTEDPDIITGLGGNDHLFGFGGDDAIDGGDGSDIIYGGAGNDTLTGGTGNDYFEVDSPGDTVIELLGGGFDLIFTTVDYTAPANVERLGAYDENSTYALTLTGNTLDNELFGNNGANLLIGGGGTDALKGFGGDDTYIVDSYNDQVGEGPGGGYDIVYFNGVTSNAAHSGFDFSILQAIGNIAFFQKINYIEQLSVYDPTSTNSVNLRGSRQDDLLTGNDGINFLEGYAGNDTLIGYGGDDNYFIDSSGDQVIEQSGGGYDTVYIGNYYPFSSPTAVNITAYTLPENFERLVCLSGASVTITFNGNALDNEITGNSADNAIDGGAGADLMMGGAGNDSYYVDNSGDVIADTAGNDTIYTSISFALGSRVEQLRALDQTGTSPLSLTGNELANQLAGNDGANTLDGGTGADAMAGLGGDDLYFVDNSGDTVIELAGDGYDTAYIDHVNFTLGEHLDRGGAFSRYSWWGFNLTGNALDNELWGDNGANVIDGKLGRDAIQGFAGADQFVFSSALTGYSNVDQLADFEPGVDKIVLDHAIFQALTPGGLSAGSFVIGTEAQDADDFIIYDPTTGSLYYDGDANGSERYAVPFAEVHETTPVTFADLFII